MTKLLIALATTVALVGPAHASPILKNKEVLGNWCLSNGIGWRPDPSHDCGLMKITPDHYEMITPNGGSDESLCRYTAVKTWFDRSIPSSTKTAGVWVSRINAECDHKWRTEVTVYISKGQFVVKEKRAITELPPKLIGIWCMSKPDSKGYSRDNCYGNPNIGDDVVIIEPNSIKDGGVTICKSVNIIAVDDPIEHVDTVYTVQLKCDSDGSRFSQSVKMWMDEDGLFIRWSKAR
jgi:hypothetical protein